MRIYRRENPDLGALDGCMEFCDFLACFRGFVKDAIVSILVFDIMRSAENLTGLRYHVLID